MAKSGGLPTGGYRRPVWRWLPPIRSTGFQTVIEKKDSVRAIAAKPPVLGGVSVAICLGCHMNTTSKRVFSNPIELYREIQAAWSAETASPPETWSTSNPAKNHCSLTALIVQDHFGGDILSTKTVGGTHFYNMIDGTRWDLTISQFAEPIPFEDTPTSREAAMSDTTPEKYCIVRERLQNRL